LLLLSLCYQLGKTNCSQDQWNWQTDIRTTDQ